MHNNNDEKKQIFADCSTDNVGISAVWSAFTGFIFLGWWRAKKRSGDGTAGPRGGGAGGGPSLPSYAAVASMAVWATVCVYYAVVEEAITTVAHAVAFAVGLVAWLLFERLHQIPLLVVDPGGERNDAAMLPPQPPHEQLRDDND
ncbi:unnamed protein product [Laminaria digitata]